MTQGPCEHSELSTRMNASLWTIYEWHRAASRVRRLRVVLRVGGWNYPGRLLSVGTRIERLAATEDSIVLIRYDLLARGCDVRRSRAPARSERDRSIGAFQYPKRSYTFPVPRYSTVVRHSISLLIILLACESGEMGGAGVRPRSTTADVAPDRPCRCAHTHVSLMGGGRI